ncbi:MAG: polysaccharide pyruvyl transferase [Chloroflexota bacterium]|nr:MAG: polysaccharide pyruvyl transferase [Chloroflexota bacterium]
MEIERPLRVGISGSYGGLNLGDEAILQCIVQELRRSVPVEITVFSRNPEDTLARHQVEHAVPVRELSRREVAAEIKHLDLFILGGGGILYDIHAATYLRDVTVAEELGVPVMVYAVGAGPLEDPSMQRLVQQCLDRAAAITVREREAQSVLERAGVRHDIVVTADPAFLLTPEPLAEDTLRCEGIDEMHRLVGISVREPGPAAPDIREEDYHGMLAYAADYMIDRLDADLVFMPMEPNVQDTQQSHAVMARMAYARRARLLRGDYTPGQLLSLASHAVFSVGMRLHFLIFSALQRVPFVALPYAGKVMGFLKMFDVPALPMKKVNIGQLIAHIDRSWDQRSELQAHLDRYLPDIQERARESNRIAVQLLTKQSQLRRASQADPS